MPAHIHIAPTAYGVVAARFGVARSEPAPAATAHPLVLLPGSPVSTEHLPRPEVVTLGLYAGNPRRRPPTFVDPFFRLQVSTLTLSRDLTRKREGVTAPGCSLPGQRLFCPPCRHTRPRAGHTALFPFT